MLWGKWNRVCVSYECYACYIVVFVSKVQSCAGNCDNGPRLRVPHLAGHSVLFSSPRESEGCVLGLWIVYWAYLTRLCSGEMGWVLTVCVSERERCVCERAYEKSWSGIKKGNALIRRNGMIVWVRGLCDAIVRDEMGELCKM